MNSKRLPGKVLMDIGGYPMIEWVVRRASLSLNISNIVVATSINKSDDPIISWCIKNKINHFRGSENDVLSRYIKCAKHYNADLVVRITADDPLKDPQIIDSAINKIINFKADYCSNTLNVSYPEGMDIEVFKFSVLEIANKKALLLSEREHVTPYIWKNPKIFKICQLIFERDLSTWSMTVDTEKDIRFIRNLTKRLGNDFKVSFNKIIELIDSNKKLKIECDNKGLRNFGYTASLKKDIS